MSLCTHTDQVILPNYTLYVIYTLFFFVQFQYILDLGWGDKCMIYVHTTHSSKNTLIFGTFGRIENSLYFSR